MEIYQEDLVRIFNQDKFNFENNNFQADFQLNVQNSTGPVNYSDTQLASADRNVQQAYERYVLSQFLFKDSNDIKNYRQKSIESLIPGTLYYYHLFFLDLLKSKKDIKEFNEDELDLFNKFKKKFGNTCQFFEIETKLECFNRLNGIPKIDENASQEDIKQLVDVLAYLEKHFQFNSQQYVQKPDYFNLNYNEESSQSESEDLVLSEKKSKTQIFNYAKFFNRQEDLKRAQEHVDSFATFNRNINFDQNIILGFQNDIDWSKVSPEYVYFHAEQMMHIHSQKSYQLFEMTNESFFDKICEYIKEKYLKYQQTKKKEDKFHVTSDIFQYFTIDQLDIIRNTLTKKGIDFKDKQFFKAYFSKVFSEELSEENQELLSNSEKLQNVIVLYNYAQSKKFSKGLCSTLLHEIMTLSIKCDDYKEDLFIEYLKNPMEKNHDFKQKTAIDHNQKAFKQRGEWNACLQNVQSSHSKERYQNWNQIDNENDVIPKYLNYICVKNKGKLVDQFKDYFNESYLKQIERKVQVYQTDKGLIDLEEDFDHLEFQKIQDEVILKFKDTNQEIFQVDEKVILRLDIKNVPELTIKIFEFNTETYYKKNMLPFDSSIDLQGLEPSYQRIERDKFKNVKKNKILTEIFEFEELKGKVGLFIIEFQGNGLMSRAVIKKGSLSLIHRSTTSGHMAFIIDSERQICKSDDTGVWIEQKFYKCNLDQNGAIFIPYISDGPKNVKLIMIHQGFAQLGEFMINTEKYDFDLFYHINSESILVGQEAHILLRPCLTINGRKTNVKQLKNPKIELSIFDFNNIPTKLTFNDLKFTDDEETIISFQVPLNTSLIKIDMQAQIQNATLKKLQNFKSQAKQILINDHKSRYQLKELYLRKEGNEYFVYCLGRNGEPQKNGNITVQVKHKDMQNQVDESLQLDKNGRVGLGELKDIEYVSAFCRIQDYIQETWYVNQVDGDQWIIPDQINIIEGESIEIPVNFSDNQQLNRHQASLQMKRDNKLIKNMFQRIKLVKSQRGASYQLLKLDGLENGEYTLQLKLNASQLRKINIIVHKGQYWQDNFILKKNCLIENYTQKNIIRLENIDIASNSQTESKLQIQLTNFSENSRVHLFSTQFVPNSSASLWNEFSKFTTKEKFIQTKFQFAKWRNMFNSELVMSDEIRYVIKRKMQDNKMGNAIDKPSLLVKKQFVQNTQTENEKLKQGTVIVKNENLNDIIKKAESNIQTGSYNRDICSNNQQEYINKIKDYQNFLSCPPIQIFNLKPNEFGQVLTTIQDLQNYSSIFVVACDDSSVCQRELSVNILQKNEIPKRDLSQNKKIDDIGLIEQRQAVCLQQDDQVHIEDITSSKVQIIDSLSKLYQIIEISFLNNGTEQDEKIQSMVQNHMLKWHQFDFEKKMSSYLKFHSHEFNFFIFKKDKEFFENVVLEHVGAKMEKTFVDWFLLSQNEEKTFHKYYLEKVLKIIHDHSELNKLNIYEKCLLLENCFKFGDETHKIKAQQLSSVICEQQKNKDNDNMKRKQYIDKQIQIFEAVLNLTDSDKENNINLEGIANQLKDSEVDLFGDHFNSQQQQIQNNNLIGMGGSGFGLFGQADPFGSSNQFGSLNQQQQQYQQQIQIQYQMMGSMQQNIMPMSQQHQPYQPAHSSLFSALPQQPQYHIAKSYAIPPPPQRNIQSNLFKMQEKEYLGNQNQKQKKAALNQICFQEVQKTAEYKETHYFDSSNASLYKYRYNENQFYSDYIKHLLEQFQNNKKQSKFLTSKITDIQSKDLPILISMIDLSQEKQQSHKFKSDGKRGILISMNSNAIIFKREIKEGECQLKNDLLVIHRYGSLINENQEEEVEDFIVNYPYKCEVIMTNVSSNQKQVTLLMQVPNGSIPLMKSKYIESKTVMIDPFSTIKEIIYFYFPKNGNYQHYPSNISENGIVVSKASIKQFDVGKKLIVKKVQTFQHLMMIQQNDEAKKKKIIDLYSNEYGKTMDQTFKFNQQNEIQYFLYQDKDFALQFLELADKLMIFDYQFSKFILNHFMNLILDEKYKDKRELIIKYYKHAIQEQFSQSQGIFSYAMNPIGNQIIELSDSYLYDDKFMHLEYFPMVNSRVFAVGGQDNQDENDNFKNQQILNTQFRTQYYRFIHLAVHQDFSQKECELNLNAKLKLQLSYYLQLQDRVDDAINVFNSIDIKDIQKGGQNDVTCQVVFDYIKAYFDFYNFDISNAQSDKRFQVARDIVKKYEKSNILFFKKAFKKIKEQLQEIDKGYAIINNEQIELSQLDEITEEQKRIALEQSKNKKPLIHDIKIDMESGEIEIDSVNIEFFIVKYYLIDTEILFSRSPFVQNQVERFSYVKPCLEIKKSAASGQNTKIGLANELKGKNLVVEINSNDIQKFQTFFSSQMLVQFNEDYGELRVCHKQSKQPLPKVYAKVFYKSNNGEDIFFRDGFTDIRGKFEYASASGKSLEDVQKFSIFVDHKDFGSLIKEVAKPKKQ